MSDDERDPAMLGELVRWGLRADALSGEAIRSGAELEDRLHQSSAALERALLALSEGERHLGPGLTRAERVREVVRATGEAATRTDLLALNFQVEAARLEDDRGLGRVAHEIRSLADRGTRGAAEVGQLAAALTDELGGAQAAWSEGHRQLLGLGEELGRARRAAEAAAETLARAHAVAAQFAAGVSAEAARRAPAPQRLEAALRLAAAAEVRGDTLRRLSRSVAAALRLTGEVLLTQAAQAEAALGQLDHLEARLEQLAGLGLAAEEIARRAKQLAINADLAAARSEDPGFGLFAEEARRLSEQAEWTAEGAQSQLGPGGRAALPVRQAWGDVGIVIRDVVGRLLGALDRFEADAPLEGDEEVSLQALAAAWRHDRVAAQELAEARAAWQHAAGAEAWDEVPRED